VHSESNSEFNFIPMLLIVKCFGQVICDLIVFVHFVLDSMFGTESDNDKG
jgi:hypothetical protein